MLTYPQRTHSACCPTRNGDLGGEVNFSLVLIKLILRRNLFEFFSGQGELVLGGDNIFEALAMSCVGGYKHPKEQLTVVVVKFK